MAKSLKELSDELKSSTKEELTIDLSKEKAKKSAADLQRKLYEAEKKTGAPVGTFKQWKSID